MPSETTRETAERETNRPQMDWQQVVLNGGPPCFFVEGGHYCGRAERWPGHGNQAFHNYVSLDDLLNAERERAARICEYYQEEDGDIANQAAAAIRGKD